MFQVIPQTQLLISFNINNESNNRHRHFNVIKLHQTFFELL